MKQHSIHTEMIMQVAKKHGPLRSKVVFLGGSATGFHLTDIAAPEIRATKDVDIIVEAASIVEYHKLSFQLHTLWGRSSKHFSLEVEEIISQAMIWRTLSTSSTDEQR